MKHFFYSTVCFLSLTMFACTNDSEEEQQDMMDQVDCSMVTFQDNIANIINNNCAISGCHVSGTGLPDYTQNSVIEDKASLIKARTSAGTMPPASSGLTLSQSQIDDIACWVDNGGKVN